MAMTSASLEEIKNYMEYLSKKSVEMEEYLKSYKNKSNSIVESTTGGSRAMAESGINAVVDAEADVKTKMAAAQQFLKAAYQSKGGVIKKGYESAEKIGYTNI